MRNCRYLIGTYFTLMGQISFAQSTNYFSNQGIEPSKPVQLIAAQRSAENVEREDQVGKTVEKHRRNLLFCYERALAEGSLRVSSNLYFKVTQEGSYQDLTADFLTGAEGERVQNLFSCISQQFKSFRAPKAAADLTFRFKLKLDQR